MSRETKRVMPRENEYRTADELQAYVLRSIQQHFKLLADERWNSSSHLYLYTIAHIFSKHVGKSHGTERVHDSLSITVARNSILQAGNRTALKKSVNTPIYLTSSESQTIAANKSLQPRIILHNGGHCH
jgi:hypothetical protein